MKSQVFVNASRGGITLPANRDITPCVVFAFNRPDKLQRVLSALKTQDVDRLIVFVDGPRSDAEVGLVEKCKAIAKEVNWVEKELHFAEQNRGLPALSDNMSMVLNLYKSAVFVEDDCLPMPGFYSFMRRALDHYESEKRVFSIGGYQPIPEKYFNKYPYSLISSARFWCWGWATWQDRWKSIAPHLPRYLELFGDWKNVPNIAGQDIPMMVKACAEGREKSWDINVAVCMLWLKQVQLLPTRGLVQNIGTEDGTHASSGSRSQDKQNRNVYEQVLNNIVWLDDVEINKYYAEELKRFVSSGNQLPRCRRLWQAVKPRLFNLV
jgi:hypothetical protein